MVSLKARVSPVVPIEFMGASHLVHCLTIPKFTFWGRTGPWISLVVELDQSKFRFSPRDRKLIDLYAIEKHDRHIYKLVFALPYSLVRPTCSPVRPTCSPILRPYFLWCSTLWLVFHWRNTINFAPCAQLLNNNLWFDLNDDLIGGYPQQTQPQEKAYPPPGEAYPPAQGYPPGQAPPPAGYAQPGEYTQTSNLSVPKTGFSPQGRRLNQHCICRVPLQPP